LGVEQALLIEEMLRERLDPATFAKHRLLCGNAAQFQGDERDVVFLSMVDGPPEDGQLPLRDEGPKGMYKKRYNVAVSRARNQLWLVYSLDPATHLKPRDLRRRLIDHARDPQALLRALDAHGKHTESPFEKAVLQRLTSAGYRVHAQWPVGAYRIDLVVEGRSSRLAVECDGEKWHTPDQLQHDIDRQTVLERMGWKFIRIRGSLFFRDPNAAMAPVFIKLDELGIEPLGQVSEPFQTDILVDRVRKAAEALRLEWDAEKIEPVNDPMEIRVRHPEPSPVMPNERVASNPLGRMPGVPLNVPPQPSDKKVQKVSELKPMTRVLDELSKLNSRFDNRRCACGGTAKPEISAEGIVVVCALCSARDRVDIDTLQRLAAAVEATCFSCNGSNLKSTARPYGHILLCLNPACGRQNTWRGISDRL
jgi:very-short-patch-repair endonuclease